MAEREDMALATRESENGELQTTHAAASAQHEIQSAIAIAKRFPRDEDSAFQKIIKACGRTSFADAASYAFQRGNTTITGPSVHLAREFARAWGNIRHGCDIVHDDEGSRTIRAWAWDLETNARVHADDTFEKLIFRKKAPDGCKVITVTEKGVWCRPDERDLRELTNRRAALAKRNCILELLPPDFIEDALNKAAKTLKDKVDKDPDGERKAVVSAFGELNVPVEQLAAYLGHPVGESSPAEIVKLRQVYKSIKDGHSTWREHLAQKQQTDADAAASGATKQKTDDLKQKIEDAKNKNGGADKPPAESENLDADPVKKAAEWAGDKR